jgi:hypothetical protein
METYILALQRASDVIYSRFGFVCFCCFLLASALLAGHCA